MITSVNTAIKMIPHLQNRYKNTIYTLETAWETLILELCKVNHFLGPVAAFVGHCIVTTLQCFVDCIHDVNGELIIQFIVTLFLAGAYTSSWTIGNPHLAGPLKNSPIFEIALMMTSGQYATSIFSSKSCLETAYSVIGLMIMSGVLSEDSGANVITTYFFLVEIASFFFQMRDLAVRCNHPYKQLADILYPIVIVVARLIGLWHISLMILFLEIMPFIHKVEVLVLTSISTYIASETLCRMGQCQRPLPTVVRQRRRIPKVRPIRRSRSSASLRRPYRRIGSHNFRSSTSFNFLTSSSRIRC